MKPHLLIPLLFLPLLLRAQWPTHFLHLHNPDVMEVRAAVNQQNIHAGLSHSLLKKFRLQYSADFMTEGLYSAQDPFSGKWTALHFLNGTPGCYSEIGATYHFGGGSVSKRFYHAGLGFGNASPYGLKQVWAQAGVAFEGKIIDFGGTIRPHFIRREQLSEVMLDLVITGCMKWKGLRPFVQMGIGMGHGYAWFWPPGLMLSVGLECKIRVKK